MSPYVKQKNQGVVLVTVLVFFQLIVMLGLYMLQTSFLSKKMSMVYWQHYHLFEVADERLQIMELNNLTESCHIGVMNRMELLAKSFNWWQDHACIGKKGDIDYYYVIELLSRDKCMKLQPIKYLRITLLAYSKNKVYKEMLQSVVIKLDNVKRDCAEDYADVHLGRQSWRRL